MATFPGGNGVGMFSEISGVLELKDGCVVLTDVHRSFTRYTVPLFPDQSVKWDDEQETIETDPTTLVMGQRYRFGGGGVEETSSTWVVPDGCPKHATYFQVGFLPD